MNLVMFIIQEICKYIMIFKTTCPPTPYNEEKVVVCSKADGLKRCELINNSSAHVFILIYSSLRVIIRIIKAKRACICVPPLPLGTPPMRATCTHIRTHVCALRSPLATAL